MGAIRRHGPLLQAILSRATGLGRGSTSTAMTSRSIHFTSFSSPRTLANSVSSLASTRVISVLRSDLVGNSAGCESCAVLIALVTASACWLRQPGLCEFTGDGQGVEGEGAHGVSFRLTRHSGNLCVSVDHHVPTRLCCQCFTPMGLWRVHFDKSRPRTRTLDKYLRLNTLPQHPQWETVLHTTSANPGGTELGDPTDAPWLCYATDAEATSVSKRWVFLRPTLAS